MRPRVALCLVARETADLRREAVPVDQQADHDLGVDPAFRGVADLHEYRYIRPDRQSAPNRQLEEATQQGNGGQRSLTRLASSPEPGDDHESGETTD